MTTLPPASGRSAGISPHQARHIAESYGSHAQRYDRSRPPYPEMLVHRIVAGNPGRDVLDVGCGTGIASRQFQAAGCRVLGVDVDARMADWARGRGLEVEVATFEQWDPAGRKFDAVVAGTAWHWIDPLAGAAKAADVLRPGGRLAPFWHVFELPAELTHAVAHACEQAMPDAPARLRAAVTTPAMDGYRAIFGRAADGIRATGRFGEPEEWHFAWQRTYHRDEWLDQLPTHGSFTRLPAQVLARVLEAAGASIDAMGGEFTVAYTTVAVTATRAE